MAYSKNNKLITFSPTHLLYLEELKEKWGSVSLSECVRQCVSLAHQRTFENIAAVRRAQMMSGARKDPTEAALADIKRADARTAAKTNAALAEGYRICTLLKGEVIGEAPNLSCRYKTYDRLTSNSVTIGELELPFENLTQDLIDSQYSPNKEKVEEALLNSKK